MGFPFTRHPRRRRLSAVASHFGLPLVIQPFQSCEVCSALPFQVCCFRRVRGEGALTRSERHRVRRLTAAGSVRLTTRTRTATGSRAVYDPEAQVFEIRGEPRARLREGDATLEAPGIRYIVGEEKWESLGGPFRVVKGEREGVR